MKIYYNGKVIAKKDQRFKDDFWTDGGSDPRIRRKRPKRRQIKIAPFTKRVIALILVLGFGWVNLQEKPQRATTIPAEAENATQGDLEPPSWIKDKYPDGEIREHDSSNENVGLFVKYFGDKAEEARLVAVCESSMIPDADNGVAAGLMQINYGVWAKVYGFEKTQLYDPEFNLSIAKQIYDRTNDWSAWYSSQKCHLLK